MCASFFFRLRGRGRGRDWSVWCRRASTARLLEKSRGEHKTGAESPPRLYASDDSWAAWSLFRRPTEEVRHVPPLPGGRQHRRRDAGAVIRPAGGRRRGRQPVHQAGARRKRVVSAVLAVDANKKVALSSNVQTGDLTEPTVGGLEVSQAESDYSFGAKSATVFDDQHEGSVRLYHVLVNNRQPGITPEIESAILDNSGT